VTKRLRAAGTIVYWVEQPVARSPVYTSQMSVIDSVEREVCSEMTMVQCIDSSSAVTKHGAYLETVPGPDHKPIALRQDDGIHLTDAGADRVAQRVLSVLRSDWGG